MSRLRLILALMALVVASMSSAVPTGAQDHGCESTPRVNCPTPESTTSAPDEPNDPDTTESSTTTTEATTTTESTTTTETTTTTVVTTTVPPTTAPPTSMPTTAPPELAPDASTTTAVVAEFTKNTLDTPSLSGVFVLVLLGLAGSAVVLGAGYFNSRR